MIPIISHKLIGLAIMYHFLLFSLRVRQALKGVQEKRGSEDLLGRQVYLPSTCGRTQQRNGLPFRWDDKHTLLKLKWLLNEMFTASSATDSLLSPLSYFLYPWLHFNSKDIIWTCIPKILVIKVAHLKRKRKNKKPDWIIKWNTLLVWL